MMNWHDVIIQEEMRAARQEAARHHRLVQLALADRSRRNPALHRMMARIGALFVAWGERLQVKYGELLPTTENPQPGSGMFSPNRLAAGTPRNSQPCS